MHKLMRTWRCFVPIAVALFCLAAWGSLVSAQAAQWAEVPREELPKIRMMFDVRMPMRDGVHLSADVWLPLKPGRYPVLFLRTPYMKTNSHLNYPAFGEYFARRGYAMVVQDVRGRGDSEGEFDWYFADRPDGYDSVEWLAAQPWSNGRVGSMGVSYLGTVQWMTALERPPHLVCMVSTAPQGRFFFDGPYQGGAFKTRGELGWVNGVAARIGQGNAVSVDWDRVNKHRPLLTRDEALGRRPIKLFRQWMAHPALDSFWEPLEFRPEFYRKIDLPVLHVTGWFDGDQPGAMSYWDGMRADSPAKDEQYLLIGPWVHRATFVGGVTKIGELEFPGDSVVDTRELHLAFFDHCLKQSTPSFDFPRARIYVTGSNKWLEEDDYPIPRMELRRFYFHGGGKANSASGDGRLGWQAPGSEPPDHYVYDPQNPAPAYVETGRYATDHSEIEQREDILVYTSEILKEPLDVVGRVFVNLYAATDGRDTDFIAKILDVTPDGKSLKLGPVAVGIIRGRYRHGMAAEQVELLTPNKPELFRIEIFDIGHTFLPGHRIRIEITSSAFPDIDPNTNTGNVVATDTDWRVARQTIFHDRDRPSHVELPILPPKKSVK